MERLRVIKGKISWNLRTTMSHHLFKEWTNQDFLFAKKTWGNLGKTNQ